MLKTLLTTAAIAAATLTVQAEDFTVSNVILPQNGTVAIEISMNNPTMEIGGFIFYMQLPEGLQPVFDTEGYPAFEKGERIATKEPQSGYDSETRKASYALLAGSSAISGTSGVLILPIIQLDGDVAVGTEFQVTLSNIQLTTTIPTKEDLDDVTFTVTVGEPDDTRTLLDENSTTAPEASEGSVDVRVKRTITAGNWSSICLPFAMTNAQMKEVFGNDVQLANFTGYEAEEDGDGNIVGITVNFANATAIEANHPYIIKVSEAITEFTVDGVDVEPEDEPVVATVKRTRKQWSEMIGTYVADTEIPSKTLFLNSNKFYYSTGATKMKAFRAYFDFFDVLTDVDNSYEVKMFVDGAETKVEGLGVKDAAGNVYDLSGRKVSKAQRGVYIVNGKKVLVK